MFWAFFCAKLRFFLHTCKNYCIFAHFLGTSMRWSKEAKDMALFNDGIGG